MAFIISVPPPPKAVKVNGREIAREAITREIQNHPAESPGDAREAAVRALVVRELLLQEAARRGLTAAPQELGEGRRETDEDALVRQLLDEAVCLPEPTEAECRRFYDNNISRFEGAAIWELPLQRISIGLSVIVMLLAGWLGLDLVGWTIRALFGLPFRQIVELPTVQMAVGVLSLLGLLYMAAAVAHRWLRLGYVALAMLLAGWMLYAFYIQQWDRLARVQWYAIPAGLYLLGIGWLEWQRDTKRWPAGWITPRCC